MGGGSNGNLEKVAPSLARFFERRLLDVVGSDHQRSVPFGYKPEYHKETACSLYRHDASGICVNAHPIDLVDRADRGHRPAPARVVFVYFETLDAFVKCAGQAHREPQQMARQLVETKAISASEEAAGGTWYAGSALSCEPAWMIGRGHSALSFPFCLAVHVLASKCRSSPRERSTGSGAVDLWFLGAPPREASPGLWIWPPVQQRPPEVDYGLRLVEAAGQRDAETVRNLLEAKAAPDFQDSRGYTALHAACAARPKWEVLEQLLGVCDLCLRTHSGMLPCDLSDMAAHDDVSLRLKEMMQEHPRARHLPQASSTLTTAAKSALGLTSIDWQAAAQVGKRQEGGQMADMLRDFSVLLMSKHKDSDAAFKSFDLNANGTISGSEFASCMKELRFKGDVTTVFKALDVDRQGDISRIEFRFLQQVYDQHLARLSRDAGEEE